jgi:glutathione S-transferase
MLVTRDYGSVVDSRPVLWHIAISHYSEKARWALDWKGVDAVRRAPQPGLHMAIAVALTRGANKTFPVLRLDGRNVGDSTAIIEALEARFPEPPLYPVDSDERRRALALEDWFDEELGPHIRLLVWHEVTRDPERIAEVAPRVMMPALARARRTGTALTKSFVSMRYRAGREEAAALAREKVVAALDRLEEELGDGDYLAGDRFSVADLTAAALLYPLVLPPEAPFILEKLPDPFERFRAPLVERRGFRWVEEMYRRHRKPALVTVG